MFRLDGKIALVTGGANGIGFACAKALASFGADIILVDIDDKGIVEVENKLKDLGGRVCSFLCDVSVAEEVAELIAKAREFGGIDIFINSAAITNRKTVLDMTQQEWSKIIDVNLNGAYYMGKAVGQLMAEQNRGGKMIYIVSTGAYRASANFGAYSASKAGVVMLMKTLALELADHNICVNAIAPTATDTKFTEDYYLKNPDKKQAVIKNHPLGRIGQPEDYMGTSVYLSSAASDFVTGSLIVVDGGKTAK